MNGQPESGGDDDDHERDEDVDKHVRRYAQPPGVSSVPGEPRPISARTQSLPSESPEQGLVGGLDLENSDGHAA